VLFLETLLPKNQNCPENNSQIYSHVKIGKHIVFEFNKKTIENLIAQELKVKEKIVLELKVRPGSE